MKVQLKWMSSGYPHFRILQIIRMKLAFHTTSGALWPSPRCSEQLAGDAPLSSPLAHRHGHCVGHLPGGENGKTLGICRTLRTLTGLYSYGHG